MKFSKIVAFNLLCLSIFGCESSPDNSITATNRKMPAGGEMGCIEGDCQNGKGTFIYANKENYTGTFKNGKRHGQGILKYSNGDIYSGSFNNDALDGMGKYSWANGDFYQGEFKNSNLSGKGAYTFQSGGVFDGGFVDGGNSGKGTFMATNQDDKNCDLNNKSLLCDSKGQSDQNASSNSSTKHIKNISTTKFDGNR